MANKKIIFIILGITVVVLTSILLVYLQFKSSTKNLQNAEIIPTPMISEDLAIWTDQSGFTFQYPKSLQLNTHSEDEENYAHLELTSATHSGNLIVWAKDTTSDSIQGWADQSKEKGFIDTTLDGESAKKLLISGETQKLSTSTVYGGYLYQIEVDLTDLDYWNKIYDTVSSTFKFVPVQDEIGKTDVTSQDSQEQDFGQEVYDEEDVIE